MTKLAKPELAKLNGLLARSASLRRLVPRSTRSAWLLLKRRPTQQRVGRLLTSAGLSWAELRRAASKQPSSRPPTYFAKAWTATKRLEAMGLTGWVVQGTCAHEAPWQLSRGAIVVDVGELFRISVGAEVKAYADTLGALLLYMKDRQTVAKNKSAALVSVSSLHDRSLRLHKRLARGSDPVA